MISSSCRRQTVVKNTQISSQVQWSHHLPLHPPLPPQDSCFVTSHVITHKDTHRISYFFNEILLSSCILLQFFLILEWRQRALCNFLFKIPLHRIQAFKWMKTQVTYWYSQCPGYISTFGYVKVYFQMYGTKCINLIIGYVVCMLLVVWAPEFSPNDTSFVFSGNCFVVGALPLGMLDIPHSSIFVDAANNYSSKLHLVFLVLSVFRNDLQVRAIRCRNCFFSLRIAALTSNDHSFCSQSHGRSIDSSKTRSLQQCFSTAGTRPGTGPWYQLYRAARGSPGICHFSFLSIFHE